MAWYFQIFLLWINILRFKCPSSPGKNCQLISGWWCGRRALTNCLENPRFSLSSNYKLAGNLGLIHLPVFWVLSSTSAGISFTSSCGIKFSWGKKSSWHWWGKNIFPKKLVSQPPFAELALGTGPEGTVAFQVVLVLEVPGLVFPQAWSVKGCLSCRQTESQGTDGGSLNIDRGGA